MSQQTPFDAWMRKTAEVDEPARIRELTEGVSDAIDPWGAIKGGAKQLAWKATPNVVADKLGLKAPSPVSAVDTGKVLNNLTGNTFNGYINAWGDMGRLDDATKAHMAANKGVWDPAAFAKQYNIPYGVMHPKNTALLNDPRYRDMRSAALSSAGGAAVDWVKNNPWIAGGGLAAILGLGGLALGGWGGGKDDDDDEPEERAPARNPSQWVQARNWGQGGRFS